MKQVLRAIGGYGGPLGAARTYGRHDQERIAERHLKIARLAARGHDDDEIARRVDLASSTVQALINAMRRAGHDIPDRKRGPRSKAGSAERNLQIARLAVDGHDYAEIVSRYGLAPQSVPVVLSRMRQAGHDIPRLRVGRAHRAHHSA